MSTRLETPWAVTCSGDSGEPPCNNGELIFLTREEYIAQMNKPNQTWRCPYCHCEASWSDDNYEEHN